jgi:hypothetical protein
MCGSYVVHTNAAEWAEVPTWRAKPLREGPVEVDRVSAAGNAGIDIAQAIGGAHGGVDLGASDQAAVKRSNCRAIASVR